MRVVLDWRSHAYPRGFGDPAEGVRRRCEVREALETGTEQGVGSHGARAHPLMTGADLRERGRAEDGAVRGLAVLGGLEEEAVLQTRLTRPIWRGVFGTGQVSEGAFAHHDAVEGRGSQGQRKPSILGLASELLLLHHGQRGAHVLGGAPVEADV